jgi:hypothetical protein
MLRRLIAVSGIVDDTTDVVGGLRVWYDNFAIDGFNVPNIIQPVTDVLSERSAATFELSDIPTATRGNPPIEVTFEVDVNGILKVSTIDW